MLFKYNEKQTVSNSKDSINLAAIEVQKETNITAPDYFSSSAISFRSEAMATARTSIGSPVNLETYSTSTLTLFFIAIFLAALSFVCTNSYSRKVTVQGFVTTTDGSPRAVASRSGTVTAVLVTEGDVVEEGQKLITLISSPKIDLDKSLSSLSNDLEENLKNQAIAQEDQLSGKLQQSKQLRSELQVRKDGLMEDISKLRSAISLQLEKILSLQETATAMHKLGEQGLMAPMNIRIKDESVIEAKQTLSALERELAQQKNLLSQITEQMNRTLLDERVIKSEGAALQAQLKEKRLNTEATYKDQIVAPKAGVVAALQVQRGAAVRLGQTIAIILPKQEFQSDKNASDQDIETLTVELWAPSNAVGFVKVGDKARLMFDSFPYQSFGVGIGTVKEVSMAAISRSELPNSIAENLTDEHVYRIKVAIKDPHISAYGKEWKLLSGMKLTADLVLEERTLLDWLLEPLLAYKRRAEG